MLTQTQLTPHPLTANPLPPSALNAIHPPTLPLDRADPQPGTAPAPPLQVAAPILPRIDVDPLPESGAGGAEAGGSADHLSECRAPDQSVPAASGAGDIGQGPGGEGEGGAGGGEEDGGVGEGGWAVGGGG